MKGLKIEFTYIRKSPLAALGSFDKLRMTPVMVSCRTSSLW